LSTDQSAAVSFVLPCYNKTAEEQTFIIKTLQSNFLFQDITGDSFDSLVSAFEKTVYPRGSVIVKQGDTNADYVYIVANGKCTVSIDGQQLPEPYGTMTKGSMVGELAMLYDAARAATVTAGTDVTVYRLDVGSFNHFVRSQPEKVEDIKTELTKIDKVIDQISGMKTRYGGSIIREFKPMRSWLWTRWRGTILEHGWKVVLGNMLLSVAFISLIRGNVKPTWSVGMLPDANNPVIARMLGLGKVWHYLMNITTFILTFFLSQAYGVWRSMYTLSRIIQGRMNDIGLLVATTAERDEKGQYTPRAEALLDDVAAYSRLFHALAWAKFTRKFEILLTDRGMSRMLSRGIMTRKQYSTLFSLKPNGGPHNAPMMWIVVRCLRAMKDGTLPDDRSLRDILFSKSLELRGTAASVGDLVDGRIPLAYAHFVQVLVDAFLVIAPFALYAELGVWSVPAVGLLTLFYSGLLDLSKILLDPLDNDDFYQGSVNMDIGVLIRESNSGSTRWSSGVETLPF
jgi:predicted membrane chloride channel (bestrophin family)